MEFNPVFPVGEYCIELGQSHEGSLGYVLSMLDSLAKRSIKLVKFQMHLPEYESTNLETFRIPLSGQDSTRSEYWSRTGFKVSEWQIIKDRCDELNIEFLCTPLSIHAVEILEKLGVKRYKIASGDLTNTQIIGAVIKTNKPIILSTGMSDHAEIRKAVDFIGDSDLTLLQCTSKYPASVQESGFNIISSFQKLYPKCKVGFSDHTGNPYLAMWAFAHGCTFVEQHVVLSKEQFGPDTSSSIDLHGVDQVASFLEVGRLALMSNVDKDEVSRSLVQIRKIFGRGISPTRVIEIGECITEELLTFKKPQGAFHWNERNLILGKTAKRRLYPDEHINFSDLND